MRVRTSFSCCSILLFTLFTISRAGDTITQSQSIKDGQTLPSAGGNFVLGFFSPGQSKNRYLGIWFSVSNEAVVWVANRDKPLNDSSGVLEMDSSGNLQLTDEVNGIIWSPQVPKAGNTNTFAQLLDSGNLVLKDGSSNHRDAVLWQSFDYPADTFLAGMKLGPDFRTGLNRSLTAWRSPDDPSPGNFAYGLDPRGLTQLILWDQGVVKYRSGPWNGLRFNGIPGMKSSDMFNFTVVITADETYFEYGIVKPNIYARLQLDSSGVIQRLVFNNKSTWSSF